MSSKRQTTMAKIKREQAVRDRRLRKQEKKDERKRVAAELKASGGVAPEVEAFDPEAGDADPDATTIDAEPAAD